MPAETVDAIKPKVHDPEEMPSERARRLLKGDVDKLGARTLKLRERLRGHGRYLSTKDRSELVAYLQRDFDKSVGAVEDVGDEPPGFGFSAEVNW